jgi:hypothetical protein
LASIRSIGRRIVAVNPANLATVTVTFLFYCVRYHTFAGMVLACTKIKLPIAPQHE